jgi:hypothetical protein
MSPLIFSERIKYLTMVDATKVWMPDTFFRFVHHFAFLSGGLDRLFRLFTFIHFYSNSFPHCYSELCVCIFTLIYIDTSLTLYVLHVYFFAFTHFNFPTILNFNSATFLELNFLLFYVHLYLSRFLNFM